MTPLLADESLSGDIIKGLREELPAADILTADEVGLRSRDDQAVLAWAAEHDRLVVSSDQHTMIGFACERVRSRQQMPGLIIVPQDLRLGIAVADLAIISQYLESGEWENQVVYLPLRR